VAVYRFDSDGEDSAGYSSTVSETSEQLEGHPRTQRQRHRRQSHPQPRGTPPHDRSVPPSWYDPAASWAAARQWSTSADRIGSPRYVGNGHQDTRPVADNVQLRSNAGSTRPQLATVGRTHVADYDDDGERRRNGFVSSRTSKYDHPAHDHVTQSQRQLQPGEGCVLSCGSVTVHNPLFIDRAHYDYIQVGQIQYMTVNTKPVILQTAVSSMIII